MRTSRLAALLLFGVLVSSCGVQVYGLNPSESTACECPGFEAAMGSVEWAPGGTLLEMSSGGGDVAWVMHRYGGYADAEDAVGQVERVAGALESSGYELVRTEAPDIRDEESSLLPEPSGVRVEATIRDGLFGPGMQVVIDGGHAVRPGDAYELTVSVATASEDIDAAEDLLAVIEDALAS